MHINQFKNLPGNPCFYSDTDSVVLQNPIDDSEIGKELGKMKLEHVINDGIFQAPKTYAIKIGEKVITKIKGYAGDISFDDYATMLIHDQALEKIQTKCPNQHPKASEQPFKV